MTGKNKKKSMLGAVVDHLSIPDEIVSGDISAMNYSRYVEFQEAMRRGSIRFVIDPRREPPEVLQS
jgi:hypothetical protein